jgi:hypothetical protein
LSLVQAFKLIDISMAHGFDEIRNGDAHCISDFGEIFQRGVALAALDASHVVDIQTGFSSQELLRPAALQAQLAHLFPYSSLSDSDLFNHPV